MVRKTKKLSYRKDDRAMHPIYGCPEYAHGYFSGNFQKFQYAFVPIDPLNKHTKFEVRSLTGSRDNSEWSF